jgi:hypothetical protein
VCGKVHDVAGFVHTMAVGNHGGHGHNFTVATVLNAGHLAPGNQVHKIKPLACSGTAMLHVAGCENCKATPGARTLKAKPQRFTFASFLLVLPN